MSDTPRTDDAVMFAVSHGMRLAPLADFCRELERENAALRADKERLTELLRRWKEFIDEAVVTEDRSNLDGDNAETVLSQINDGAEEMLALLTPEERAAIDAARKRAQP